MSSTNAKTEEKLKKIRSWWEDIKCSHTKKDQMLKQVFFPQETCLPDQNHQEEQNAGTGRREYP